MNNARERREVVLWEKRMGDLVGEIQAQHGRVMACAKALAADSPAREACWRG